jgi:hypothetical protein
MLVQWDALFRHVNDPARWALEDELVISRVRGSDHSLQRHCFPATWTYWICSLVRPLIVGAKSADSLTWRMQSANLFRLQRTR